MIDEYPFLDKKYAFTVCRIEPENNLHLILEAFEKNSPFPLVIVGNWQNSEYGQKLFRKYSSHSDITLLDPIYNQQKLNSIRTKCRFYLHGHSCGGTNPSLVEAMYLGLPVIAFDVNFNRETTENQALYFDSPLSLKKICIETTEEQCLQIGRIMKEIALRRYTWKRISECYAKLF